MFYVVTYHIVMISLRGDLSGLVLRLFNNHETVGVGLD